MMEMDWFTGASHEFVLIVAGIHSCELSGIEVANWVRVKLRQRQNAAPMGQYATRLGAVVIPEMFPDLAKEARFKQWKVSDKDSYLRKFREIMLGDQKIYPNRQFPPPGKDLSFLKNGFLKDDGFLENSDKDNEGYIIHKKDKKRRRIPLLPEMRGLIAFIETFAPVRIVSIHGMEPQARKRNSPGIFVDPRYEIEIKGKSQKKGLDLEACKFKSVKVNSAVTSDGKKDDNLALQIAKAVSNPRLVPGNHLDRPPEVVHYAKTPETPPGFSIGDWAPVKAEGSKSGKTDERPGIPVFTIEVIHYRESGAFLDGQQVRDENGEPLISSSGLQSRFNRERSRELQVYAEAIIDTVLESI